MTQAVSSRRIALDAGRVEMYREIEETVEWLTVPTLPAPRRTIRCLGRRRRAMKRAFDVCGACVLLVLLSPLMAATAVLVKLTSPGPAIFEQTRVGLNRRTGERRTRRADGPEALDRRRGDRRTTNTHGRLFTIYKFRTMCEDAEAGGARFSSKGDMRVTTLGRFLRRTRIDELPQLWNVIRGEMSLVGPRPERPEFVGGFVEQIPGYRDRLQLKPGLTGLAQVENGYDSELDDFRRKAVYDAIYVQRCTIRNDLRIMARTVKVVITGKGAC